MCTYRVIHRLHHNNLYGELDPDTALHGGYPRGKAYLVEEAAEGSLRVHGVEDLRVFPRRSAGAQHARPMWPSGRSTTRLAN